MHTDEAVNAYITGQLLAGEKYQYDPQDRHGPALYLAALPIARAAGAKNLAELSETTVRLVPVIWSALTLLLFAAVANQIGFRSAIIAALLWAMAPLPVYYGRYFIHETLFVTATFAFVLSGWRALENKSLKAGMAAGLSAGFMLACKETALLHFVAFGLAGMWWAVVRRDEPNRQGLRWKPLLKICPVALTAFALIVFTFYTWGGQHWRGPLDLLQALPRFANRASGEGHEKPFSYYFRLLGGAGVGWAVLVLAVVGGWARLKFKAESQFQNPQSSSGLFVQLLAIYAVAITLIYSAIPYKTPWLALNLWLPISLLAGNGFVFLLESFSGKLTRLALTIFGGLLLALLAHETWQWGFSKPADERNPYAYAHTGEDMLRLPERLNQIARQNQTGALRIAVVASDPWPLPWYLRKFPRVGFWQPNQDSGSADVYLTSPEAAEALTSRLQNWRPEFFGVRPEVLMLLWTPIAPAHE